MEKGTFLKRGRGALIIKYAFGLFISLHHDSLGSSFSHGGEFFLARRIFFFLTELTDLTELFHQRFESMRSWPLPQPLPRREGRSM